MKRTMKEQRPWHRNWDQPIPAPRRRLVPRPSTKWTDGRVAAPSRTDPGAPTAWGESLRAIPGPRTARARQLRPPASHRLLIYLLRAPLLSLMTACGELLKWVMSHCADRQRFFAAKNEGGSRRGKAGRVSFLQRGIRNRSIIGSWRNRHQPQPQRRYQAVPSTRNGTATRSHISKLCCHNYVPILTR